MTNLSVSLRPETLDQVIGHEAAKTAIHKQLAAGRTPRALMFYGPPGVGKTTLANIVARMVQGEVPEGTELDITTVNGGDKGGVDDIRELVATSAYRPLSGQYKVVILDEAQQITAAAQNCLLLPFEKQDSSTIWIICTTNPEKILPALKTRCLSFELRGMAEVQVIELIERASEELGVLYDDEFTRHAVNLNSDWSPRELLMAYEKYVGGTPLTDCFSKSSEHEPLYIDIAKAVLSGNWNRTRESLKQVKTADARALRTVLASKLGWALLDEQFGVRADAISGCLVALGQSSFEDGLAYQALRGALYRCCKQLIPPSRPVPPPQPSAPIQRG